MLGPNLVAALSILMLARRVDTSPWRGWSHLVAAYLLLIAPCYVLVQLDLLATALLVAGVVIWFAPPRHRRTWWSTTIAMVMIAFAVSTRPQFALVLWAFALLAIVAWLSIGRLRRERVLPALAALVFIAALAGFALDSGLRALAGRSEAVRSNSAVTLYSGFLDSPTSGRDCGRWSAHATATTRADLGQSLASAAIARIEAKPISHWAAVVHCKLPQIVAPQAFAGSWLLASPNIAPPGIDAAHWQNNSHVRNVATLLESWSYNLLMILIYSGAIAVVLRRAWRQRSALLPVLWFAAFLAVHAIFEVQGRYFLSMLLLMPLWSALVSYIALAETMQRSEASR